MNWRHLPYRCLPKHFFARLGIAAVCTSFFLYPTGESHAQETVRLTDQPVTPAVVQPPIVQGPVVQGPVVQGNVGNQAPLPQVSSTQEDEEAKKLKKKREELKKKAASAHKPLFFDNDFSYLCDENWDGWFPGDGLKRRGLPGGGWFDIGGQFRSRYHAERNMRGLGLTGVDDDFLLRRTRIYGDFHFTPNIRVYAEMLDAESTYENFGPRPIEVNRADMQNLFVDARLIANGDSSLTARVGRQELLFGSQRAVSPLDWANTRRNFEGVRFMLKQKDRTLDAFWTNPIRIDDSSFDSPDRDQEFMGIYSSYKGRKNQTFDTYFLRLLNGRGANNFQFNTIGVRWQGSQNNMLWDFESAYQFGDNTDGSSHVAGMGNFWHRAKAMWLLEANALVVLRLGVGG